MLGLNVVDITSLKTVKREYAFWREENEASIKMKIDIPSVSRIFHV